MDMILIIAVLGIFAICVIWCCFVLQKRNRELIAQVTSFDRGTKSEKRLILTLIKLGIQPQAIFHDLYVSKEDGNFSQIDLVVATQVGMIVFEVKDYKGWIFGNGCDQKWTQVLSYGKEKYRFYNPVKQNNAHIKQLKLKLGENIPFYSVIVFYGDSKLQDISFIPKRTYVTKSYRVAKVVKSILEINSIAHYKDKHRIVKILKEAVANGDKKEIEKQHIENIKDMLGIDRVFK